MSKENITKIKEVDMLYNTLSIQKSLTNMYNESGNEAYEIALRDTITNILTEEHMIRNEISSEISKRGWEKLNTEKIDTKDLKQTFKKFTEKISEL
ncbi:MAG: spore coat protein [Oscillospiraceae bacterium]|nr:spore coat protein [Oscillospiraceae bacterium]